MSRAAFDSSDVDELTARFNAAQLRIELANARMNAWLAESFRGTEYEIPQDRFPWSDYASACQLALDIRTWLNTPVKESKPNNKLQHIDIEALKARNDIVDIISQHTKLHRVGSRYYGRCPFHADKVPSFWVYPESQSYYCFGCKASGDVIDFMMRINNISFRQATEALR